jgi:hypothetical protein
MRLIGTLVFLLAGSIGCHGAKATGPAWPAPSTTADDGGESIELQTTTVAASVEKSADAEKDEPSKPAAEDKPAAPAAEDKSPTLSQPQPAPSTDDILMTDDLIIEIDE